MTFEVEVPVRHRTLWLAFTDPEKMARAVPGLTVDAVHPVPPADGPEGVAGDVVAGRLKLRVGAGTAGNTITYRGTGCIAGAEAHRGTLDIAVDAAQARGNGALAGYLRITLAPAGDAGERTLVSVVPELELSGRALEFAREDWHAAVTQLAATWVDVLAADYLEAVEAAGRAMEASEGSEDSEDSGDSEDSEVLEVSEAPETPETVEASQNTEAEAEAEAEIESESTAPEPSDKSRESTGDDSLSDDPLEPVWQGRYEKSRWLPVITALTLFLLIKRRRRQRADQAGADSSFRME
ncbi:hypothetical protein [Catenulispora subtropica]|uniref:Carbon monoxide dehydrogenase subunit G n=1 Tax=Catenulispora subtropica TaxID=450798 RepID=A0ABP5E086_9ACTN